MLVLILLLLTDSINPNAHAHNDYLHPRPHLDALDQGFCSVEADIFHIDNQLLVAHTQKELKPDRSLEVLYLRPLRERIQHNKGHIFPGYTGRFYLFIDLKTDSATTYPPLHQLLTQYADILTEVRDGQVTKRPITVILSGSRPSLDDLAKQSPRYAAYDGRLKDLDSSVPTHLMPVISDNWATQLGWSGNGTIPRMQHEKLMQIIAKAHSKGREVRFWATPEKENLWKLLREEKVDLINTDKLKMLREFLESKG